MFYESLQRLLFEKLESGTAQLDDYFNDQFQFSKSMFKDFSESEGLVQLFQDYLNLKDELINSAFALPKFWISYIEMVELLLNVLYACRAGNWDLLLEYIRDILPFAFAYDHINYARYLTYMLGDLLSLESEFPEIYEQWLEGNFAAQLSDGVFKRVETDKVIEMTLNKRYEDPRWNNWIFNVFRRC